MCGQVSGDLRRRHTPAQVVLRREEAEGQDTQGEANCSDDAGLQASVGQEQASVGLSPRQQQRREMFEMKLLSVNYSYCPDKSPNDPSLARGKKEPHTPSPFVNLIFLRTKCAM